jgi:PTH1 family peptidyl-tRNA hydrolase
MPDAALHLIVGLGNPGRRYQGTRHNAGFMVADRIYDRLPHSTTRSRFQADYVETRDDDRRVVIVKPHTFMNDSGSAVGQIQRWFKVPNDRLLVVYDELDLPFGQIRLRASGSDGGHNGVASIIQHLRTQEFPRLRIGIGRPRAGSSVHYVLSPFTPEEQCELSTVIDRAADAALSWLRDGITAAMNEHNRRPSAPAGGTPARHENTET